MTSTATAVDTRRAEAETAFQVASQWQLMWWRFRKHRLALVSGYVIIFIFAIAALAEFLAPFPTDYMKAKLSYAPPQSLHFWDRTENGLELGMFVYGYSSELDPVALQRNFVVDESRKIPVRMFAKGEPYELWNLIPWDRHLVGPVSPGEPMFLLGADRLGRDVLSRMVYGTRISMTVGLVGVALSLVLGILLGGIAGYFGGAIDVLVQRTMEILRSMPTIPLWMGLAAAIPLHWSPTLVYFMITIILSVIGWTWLAQVVRGKFYSLKTEDFVTAAKLDGCSELRIILRHMVPSFMSHIIATVTLAIPAMILAETALSFLGIGLRPPVVSWGVLLKEAQNIRSLATAPWLFWPGAGVIVAVLALNFLGDGIRDAADPYK